MTSTNWIRWCVLALCLAVAPAWAANITVHVDRNPVQLDESFQLIFNADGSVDEDPDFSPLEKDFEIVSRSQNTSMQIINMSISRRTSWTLSLMAKSTGTLTIPAISFGKDRSPVSQVTVQAASQAGSASKQAGDIFIEVEAKPEKATVQAQMLYTVRLFRAVNVVEASLTDPKVSGLDAVVTKLGDDVSYETLRGNRSYVVTERRYAIYPQKSGQMVIEPVVFEGRYVDRYNSLRSKRIHSDALALDVQPMPAEANGKSWLPAAKVTLSEQWPEDPPKFTVGEPVTRTLVLQAQGLTAAQLPNLSPKQIDGFKSYAEQPQLDDKPGNEGMVGTRRESVALVATQPGTYTLPEITIPWWNINTRQQETARIPARTIQVLPATGSVATTPPAAEATAPAAAASEAVTTLGNGGAGGWPWVAGISTLGWVLTLLAWWRERHRQQSIKPAQPAPAPVTKSSVSLKRLANACRNGNAEEAKAALLAWAQQHWPDDPATNLGHIAQRLGGEAEREIQRLNEMLYGANNQQPAWNGEALYQAIQGNKPVTKRTAAKEAAVLPPLYS